MIYSNLEKTITNQLLGQDDLVAFKLGGNKSRDFDLVIIDHLSTEEELWEKVARKVEVFNGLSSDQWNIFVKRAHMSGSAKNSPTIHLLYYPSIMHLLAWETDLFIDSLLENAELLHGSKSAVKELREQLKRRSNLFKLSKLDQSFDLYMYDDIAITNIVYLSAKAGHQSQIETLEALRYILRFTIISKLRSSALGGQFHNLWSRAGLVNYLKEQYPLQYTLTNLLSHDFLSFTKHIWDRDNLTDAFLYYIRLSRSCPDFLNYCTLENHLTSTGSKCVSAAR